MFARHFSRELLLFSCVMTPPSPLASPQPVKVAFPLGSGRVLRFEEVEGEDFGKEEGVGEVAKRREKGRAHVVS